MKVVVFSSGSDGNVTLVRAANHNILIDAGLSKKCIESNLSNYGLSLKDIDSLLITHEHVDHVKAFPMLLKECQIKIFLTRGTYSYLYNSFENKNKIKACELMKKRVDEGTIIFINRMEKSMLYYSYNLDDLKIEFVPTFHDASESVGFVIHEGEKRIVYITDTGYVHQGLYPYISNADAYILESNHDPEILMHSNRPYPLKIRILSDHGHMSNEDSMLTLVNIIGNNTRLVMHAHISQECNLTQIVEMTRDKIFGEYGINTDQVEFVILAPRPSKEYEV